MRSIKIGTRNSPLALWQAREVARHLQNLNYTTDITPIVSTGDKNLTAPLYAMGITGVFTRDLDAALLAGDIDVAVHSLKDIPTVLPEGIEIISYLERDFPQDVLVRSKAAKDKKLSELLIATSSLRRRAFWKNHFPHAEFVDIRGNVQTRLEKLESGVADATMFSQAGLERLELPVEYEEIPQLLCAPSQGVVAVTGRTDNQEINTVLRDINDFKTQICVEIERDFLRTLEGGCTAPIGAYAELLGSDIRFQGRICSLDGVDLLEIEEVFAYDKMKDHGVDLAEKILDSGARALMQKIKGQIG